MIKVIQSSSSEVKNVNLRAMIDYVSAYFETISNVLVSSSNIVLGWMEEEGENLNGDVKFYFLLAMAMRAKKCTDWFKPDDKGEVHNINSLKNFSFHNVNNKCFRSQKTALRIH